ncbi:MAG: MFS transporter, partial [Arenimonas sp.]|nr:MFS transporter [Arenimonas sp.]
FNTAPTRVGTAIVVHSIAVAAFIMLGAKLGQRLGSTRVFQWASGLLLVSSVMVALSPDMTLLIVAQGLAGVGAAMILPALVVLVADNYSGRQKARAIGILGAVQAGATVAAFFLAGAMGASLGWRWAFGLIVPLAAITCWLSRRLRHVPPVAGIEIDGVGVVLCALSMALVSLGFVNVTAWGVLLASPTAPVSLFGLSPAFLMILAGLFGIQLFLAWCQRRRRLRRTPLLALEVLHSRAERTAVVSLMAIVVIGSGLNFLVPLYIQMVQGRNSLETAAALVPYQLAVLAASLLVVGLYDRVSPRRLARGSFAMVAIAMVVLAATMRYAWGDLLVVASLVVVGLGQGTLLTLLFSLLLAAAPQHLVGDVGALRGAARNLANAVGTALSGALVVGLLGANIQRQVEQHPLIPASLIAQVNLDRPAFLNNEQLDAVVAKTTATPAQAEVAAQINADARLRSLKLALMFLAGLSLLMIVPAGGLPGAVGWPATRPVSSSGTP